MREPDWRMIGQRIRMKRKERKMTRARLAEAAELSDVYVAYIEQGKRSPTLETLYRIAEVLETEVGELLGETGGGGGEDGRAEWRMEGYDEREKKVLRRFIGEIGEMLEKDRET